MRFFIEDMELILFYKFKKKIDIKYMSEYTYASDVTVRKNVSSIFPKYKIIDFWKNGHVGIKYTFLRESFATGIYFKTYDMMKTWGASPFFAGGVAGCNSWLLTYPIDTMKTRYQLDTRMDWKVTLRRGGLFDGLAFCLLRAFLVNGISFTFYEMV